MTADLHVDWSYLPEPVDRLFEGIVIPLLVDKGVEIYLWLMNWTSSPSPRGHLWCDQYILLG